MSQHAKSFANYPGLPGGGRKTESRTTSYRGFASMDQEMELEIALQWFLKTNNSGILNKSGGNKQTSSTKSG